jgi:ABC-type dipeptide/oligopeptide/nickel transport system permease subunit
MIAEGQAYYRSAPWLILSPGVMLMLTVLGFNLMGDGLRDALDPHQRR